MNSAMEVIHAKYKRNIKDSALISMHYPMCSQQKSYKKS